MFAVVQLPAGASLERTNAAVDKLTAIANATAGIDGVASISGFNLLTGLSTSYNATAFIRMKPWDERTHANGSATALVRSLTGRLNSEIKDANILVLNPPPIRGLGTTGGFEFVLQGRGGHDLKEFSQTLQNFLGEARKRPELGFVFANYDDRVPQIEYEVDRDKVKSLACASRCIFHAADIPGRLLRERLQPLRPHVPRAGAGEGSSRVLSGRRETLLRAQRQWRYGAVEHDSQSQADQCAGVFSALQHLPLGEYQWRRRTRLQLGPGSAGDGRTRQDAARRIQL